MGTSNDKTGRDESGETPQVPRLTLGQRVLASLPNLQRRPGAAAGRSPAAASPSDSSVPRPTTAGKEGGADSVVTPDEVLSPGAGGAPTRRGWREAFGAPATASPRNRAAPSGMTKEELNHVIKRIDDRERTLALGAAVLGVAVGVVLTVAAFHLNPPPHHANHEAGSVILDYGIARVVLAAVVVLSTWKRRRSFVAFALLLLGTAMGNFLFALPFWALALWMIFRVMKWQRELAAITKGAATGRSDVRTGTRPTSATSRPSAVARSSARTPRGRRTTKQPEPTGPPRSKRYTPPKTVRPRPPGG